MTKILVVAHAQCLDGFCAAWAAHSSLSKIQGLQVTYHFAFHGSEIPDIAGHDTVYLLDFAYPRKEMMEICNSVKQVVVLDHHVSAQTDLLTSLVPEYTKRLEEGAINAVVYQELVENELKILKRMNEVCIFDLTKSGATLAWDYFMGTGLRPWIVDYVEDGDLWKWEKDRSKYVNAAIFSYQRSFAMWDKLVRTPLEDVKLEGAAIFRYQTQLIEEALDKVRFITVGDYRVPAVNSSALASEIASRIACIHKAPFGVVWIQLPDGKFKYSLRKNSAMDDTPDLSKIALSYGGGGHRGSASFRSSKLFT